ncbi:MAG: hypothetical protein FJ291_00760 [Planctomycetes bacterium]|nr:hypothetical protein [Planctomycetota bacterium]
MAHAYTPGLRVTQRATVRKERRLPIAGQVLVQRGARVQAEDVVARAELPGDVATVNVVNLLGITPGEIHQFMLKKEGDAVGRDEPIAETRPWLKWLKTTVRSPVAGTVESVSAITGQVLVRMAPRPVELTAYLDGVVAEVAEREGVVVETHGAFVQGIFGVGGEVYGEVALAVDRPDASIGPGDLGAEFADKIVIAGNLVTSGVYERASALNVAALVCGGFHDSDLRRLLGYDLGVAITGHEDIQPILIVTEGFGPMAMAEATFELLKSHVGQRASANGATQIRAGVLRPEIIIPTREAASAPAVAEVAMVGLTQGSRVRIIREPGFGRIGNVTALPPAAVQIETESRVRVAKVQFPDGTTVTVPRANLEAIET